jgi:DhnA family fructose-bisphosphate aldolase class Ia
MISQTARLNRLLGPDRKCLVVALDHGTTGEPRVYQGLEDLATTVQVVAQSLPDAILLSLGQSHLLQEIPGRGKPSLVVRSDVTNIYARASADPPYCSLLDTVVEQAVREDAVCVIANLLHFPDSAGIQEQCIRNIALLRSACDRYGMPLMVETRSMRRGRRSGACEPSGRVESLSSVVRQAVELGADLIKTDPTEDPQDVDHLVKAASGKPVLVLGGGRVTETELIRRTQILLEGGISGLVYGRNVFAQGDPARTVRALMAMVHEGGFPGTAPASGLGQDLTRDQAGRRRGADGGPGSGRDPRGSR